jgi:Mg-chelatase subunit ChlD
MRFLGLTIRSRHVAFVLDGSGSMAAMGREGRTRWAEVVRELEQVLAGLAGAHVNLAVFQEHVEAALPRSLPLDAARREVLMRFVRARVPRGKTALYDGIAWGLGDPEVDTVVVLSDGAPSAGQFFTRTDLLSEVRRANRYRRARIDVVAVGADDVARRWRDALQQIAKDSGGSYVAR